MPNKSEKNIKEKKNKEKKIKKNICKKNKEKTVQRKHKTSIKRKDGVLEIGKILNQPSLLLSTIYFLNNQCNRHVVLGYAPENECRPLFILGTMNSFVSLSTTDWVMLMLSKIQISSWFNNEDDFENDVIISKNIKIAPFQSKTNKLICIENLNCDRANKSILLSEEEYNKCVDLDSIIHIISKQMQQNSIHIDDYFNMYIYYCLSKEKTKLSELDFFPPNDTNTFFDTFRLFKEIPLLCAEQVEKELCKSKMIMTI